MSVIVPVYKVEPYLPRCVDSVLGQSFSDLDLVLVDDGSPEGCGGICDAYAAKDSRVCVVHKPNGGLSDARNVGIDWAMACSDSWWLAFVDSDDWVHPRYLEYLHRAAKERCSKLAVCEHIEKEGYEAQPDLCYKAETVPWDDLLVNDDVRAVVAWNKLYAKELFEGLRYPVGRIHEDEFLTYKLLHRAGDIAFVPVSLYCYFQNPDGIMRGRFSVGRLDAIDAFAERISYVHKNGLSDLGAWATVSYFEMCIGRTREMTDAKWIPGKLREREERRIRRQARTVLVRYGLRYLSPCEHYTFFSFAFPRLMRAARKPFVLAKRMKRGVRRIWLRRP